MMKDFDGKLLIDLGHIGPNLKMEFKDADERFFVSDDFEQNNEAKYQFSEGVFYAYSLFEDIGDERKKSDWIIDVDGALKGVFKPFSKKDISEGMFAPNTFVGTLSIPLINGQKRAQFSVEVHSSKIDYKDRKLKNKLGEYRSEYQLMLEDIAEHSIELVLQYNVPIQQSYESGLEQLEDEKELFQRFLFVRSLFKNLEFEESVQKIISNPATRWVTEMEERDVRSIRRFSAKNIREMASRPNRMPFPDVIPGLKDIPLKISSTRKIESFDTPENRFIKHILDSFLIFCETIESKLEKAKMLHEVKEVKEIAQRIDNLLNQPFFKDISRPTSLKINSPILQRRSGYRELLRSWLRFHLRAQLSWKFDNDEDNLFSGGKKDIASLYEYWVFFVLFSILSKRYGQFTKNEPEKWVEGLIVPNKFGLGLTLQEGKTRAFEFVYNDGKRPLNIKFYYNRPFAGGKIYENDKSAGSYSKSFRPDYTLSIWPKDESQIEAEETESIVHVHFDAKYKVEYSFLKEERPINTVITNIESESLTNEEKEELNASAAVSVRENEEKKGIYKNIDLYKMHAYKDAIRRSGGAYILYPGNSDSETNFQGFHEIIPGVGAFALRPNNEGIASKNIKDFFDKVINNLEDVLSQREQIARNSKKVYGKNPTRPSIDSKLDQLMREIGETESLNDTTVLVGYCKGPKHKNWIEGINPQNKMLYNIRFGNGYIVDGKTATAKFLILYSNKDFEHSSIYKIKTEEGNVITRSQIESLGYDKASHDLYFLYSLDKKIELGNYKFNNLDPILKSKIEELEKNKLPFTLSMDELASIRIEVD
jgi:predicted component of viral defense system (DUF524 family)